MDFQEDLMSQDYYDFIHSLNDDLLKASQLAYTFRGFRPNQLGFRHRLQLRLSDFLLSLGLMIRPKIALPGDQDSCLFNGESYAS